MPTLIHHTREEGDFGALVKKAETGDVIRVCDIQSDQFDFHPADRGVMEFTGTSFLLNGKILYDYSGPCRNWSPYEGDSILIFTDDEILHLSGTGLNIVHKEGPQNDFQLHVPTETVLIGEDGTQSYLLVRRHKSAERKLRTKWKVLPYWSKEFADRHVRPLKVPYGTKFHMGHPEGPVFLMDGEFVLVTPEKREVIHKAQNHIYQKWIACAMGIVDLVRTDQGLAFNEKLKEPFYHGNCNEVIPTSSGCVVVSQDQFFLPFQSESIARLPWDEVCQHRYGVLVVKDKQCSVLVVK